ncbi:MAG: hypothetical protein M9894_33530 [Planctomycetes bacterium]|nr:hypothetical protein [Planctomycetota bacterium]
MRVRAWLRAALTYAWDNPSAEQEARAMLAAHKVGLWLGLEALAIGAAAGASLLFAQQDRGAREAVVTLGAGPFLTFVALGVVALLLTLFVPLRAVGLLEGPRWRGYLDQLVTTGITPLRYHAGKWAACQPFFLALLGASLPFVALFGLLGGATPGRTVVAYALLWAYANLLLLVTMALGVLLHEALALLIAWAAFGGAIAAELAPLPSTVACLTPVRFLVQPLVGAMSAGAWASTAERLYGDPRPFGLELPWPVWALGVWAALGLLATLTVVSGPLQGRPPGLNTFGLVVLPGDAGRAFFRRVRPLLLRRVELAFLFENRGPRLVRLTLPSRWLQQVALALLVAALLLGAVFDVEAVAELGRASALVAFAQLACCVALWLPLLSMGGGWPQASVRWVVGGWRLGPAAMDVAAFLVVAAAVIALHALGFTAAWEAIAALEPLELPGGGAGAGAAAAFAASSALLVTQVTCGLVALLAIKAVAARALGPDRALIGGALFMLGLLLLPLLVASAAVELARHEELVELRPLAAAAFFVGLASPLSHVIVLLAGVPPDLPHAATSGLLTHGFWLWQAVLVALLGAHAWAGHRSLAREAEALERLAGPAPPDLAAGPPCAACGCPAAVPAGVTAWGGVLGTRLLGVRRCLDCRGELLARTGDAPGAARLLVLGARAAAALLAVAGLALALQAALAEGL